MNTYPYIWQSKEFNGVEDEVGAQVRIARAATDDINVNGVRTSDQRACELDVSPCYS
jgi:hypothetical protein